MRLVAIVLLVVVSVAAPARGGSSCASEEALPVPRSPTLTECHAEGPTEGGSFECTTRSIDWEYVVGVGRQTCTGSGNHEGEHVEGSGDELSAGFAGSALPVVVLGHPATPPWGTTVYARSEDANWTDAQGHTRHEDELVVSWDVDLIYARAGFVLDDRSFGSGSDCVQDSSFEVFVVSPGGIVANTIQWDRGADSAGPCLPATPATLLP